MKNYLNSLQGKSIVITGTSAGIGLATAQLLCEIGCSVTGISRRNQSKKINSDNYKHLSGDLNDHAFLKSLFNDNIFNCDVFINNAGLALGKDHFINAKEEDIELVIQTNISTAFKIAQEALKKMKTRGEGDIVNICSIASHEAYAGGVVYCASKHALLAMGKALRAETYGENIRIINVSPGMVETEFSLVRFKGDAEKAKKTYEGFSPLNPEDIAYQIYNAISCPRHVNLDEIIILATDQSGATNVKRK